MRTWSRPSYNGTLGNTRAHGRLCALNMHAVETYLRGGCLDTADLHMHPRSLRALLVLASDGCRLAITSGEPDRRRKLNHCKVSCQSRRNRLNRKWFWSCGRLQTLSTGVRSQPCLVYQDHYAKVDSKSQSATHPCGHRALGELKVA